MKKIITVLFAVLAMSSMFAYIPNKKKIEKVDNRYICYHKYKDEWGKSKYKLTTYIFYEDGEIYLKHPLYPLNYTTKEIVWKEIETDREMFESMMRLINNKYYNEKEEKEWRLYAKQTKKNSLNQYPFITEENWKTITKEEWIEQLESFFTEIKD